MTTTFSQLRLSTPLVAALARRGVSEPFPVQAASIPDLLLGRDLCGRAPTGSGKTLAFGLPVLARVARGEPRRPRALVLAPTRELAQQIHDELAPLAAAVDRRIAAVYGGVGLEPQRKRLARGVDVLVACPGRLEDLIGQRAVSLEDVDIVVVDEADRLADMGFLPAVRRLLDQTVETRQTILFSATLDRDVAALTERYQQSPIRHEIGGTEPDVDAMEHVFTSVDRADKIERTATAIMEHGSTIVFCRTRHGADRVAHQLNRAGVEAAAIHGGRSQPQRSRALHAFADGRAAALVATDVAARGIHVDDVACVVHFDPPADAKDYVHRSGRTARAGRRGVVVSLVTSEQVNDVRRIQRELGLVEGVDGHRTPTTTAGDRPAPGRSGAASGSGTGSGSRTQRAPGRSGRPRQGRERSSGGPARSRTRSAGDRRPARDGRGPKALGGRRSGAVRSGRR